MEHGRSSDNYSLQFLILEEAMIICFGVYLRVARSELLQNARAGVTDSVKGTQLGEIPHQVLTPVATADNRYIPFQILYSPNLKMFFCFKSRVTPLVSNTNFA